MGAAADEQPPCGCHRRLALRLWRRGGLAQTPAGAHDQVTFPGKPAEKKHIGTLGGPAVRRHPVGAPGRGMVDGKQ